MKSIFFSIAFCFFCIILITFVATSAEKDSHFHRVEVRNENIGFSELGIEATYRLTENDVIAIGFDTSVVKGPGWVLYLLNEKKQQIIYQSDIYDTYGGGWELNVFKTQSHILLLWEVEIENYTLLPLYVFDLKSKQFECSGNFDVYLYFDEVVDYAPYLVKDIGIQTLDTSITFKFTKKLWLNTSDSTSLIADSLVYELNLRTDTLHTAEIWKSDTTQ